MFIFIIVVINMYILKTNSVTQYIYEVFFSLLLLLLLLILYIFYILLDSFFCSFVL